MGTFEALANRLAKVLALLGGLSLLLMMLQTVGDLIMARVFSHPVEGNMEVVSVYHMVLAVFLPLAIVELRHEHISADLFVQMLRPGPRRAVYVFGSLISLAFFGALCYQTWVDALQSFKIDEVVMGSIYVPVWPAKFALPIGFVVMFLAVVLHLLKALFERDFDPSPSSPELQENLPAI